MNEMRVSREGGMLVRENEPWIQRSGRDGGSGDGIRYYTQQRIAEYVPGGRVASNLMARDYKSASDLIVENKPSRKYIVRRLTPLECCRLQGFPDWWTDGVEGSDSAQYRMWGNGIALPCAVDVLGRIAKEAHDVRTQAAND